MDAAAIPFPNDETTPPVIKMYLAIPLAARPLKRSRSLFHPYSSR